MHVITWNAMIHGYGSHGFGQVAVELFEEMKGTDYIPLGPCGLQSCWFG
jgi:pentatricopeptide repeat protein